MKRGFAILLLLLIFAVSEISALGIGPAISEFNFRSGAEHIITFKASGIREDRIIEVFFEGELAEYFSSDKNVVSMNDNVFSVRIKLPDSFEKPGPHKGFIGVREKIDPELVGGAIGTSIEVKSLVQVNVPYPGKYLDVFLEGHDINLNEPVEFFLTLKSQGDEVVTAISRIEIYDENNGSVKTLNFNERVLESQEEIELRKVLDTTGFNAGSYRAVALVDYGGENFGEDEIFFRVGELKIEVINYTKEIVIGGIKPFEIGIESGWNDEIDGAYADVSIRNKTNHIVAEFKTSSTNLVPWEKRVVTGYLETDGLEPGKHKADITLIYYGKERGVTTSRVVEVEFVKEFDYLIFGIILIVLLVAIIGAIFLFIKIRRKKNGKRKK